MSVSRFSLSMPVVVPVSRKETIISFRQSAFFQIVSVLRVLNGLDLHRFYVVRKTLCFTVLSQ